MKRLLSLLLCGLLLSGCAATYDGPTETELVLTEYEVRHYSPFFDDAEVDINRSVYAYDIYGNRVRELEYDNGELAQETRTTYDEEGRELTRIVIDRSGWIPKIEYRSKQTYDEQGRLLSYSSYDMWGRKNGETLYRYDDEQNTMIWSNSSGDEVTYYYDETGKQLRDVSIGVGGAYETVYTYDERGNRTGWTSTKDGKLFSRYEAGYDEQNRLIWGIRYDENGTQEAKTTYTYDDEANTMTTVKDGGGKRVKYYDADGRIHLIEENSEDGKLTMIQQYFYQDIRVPATGEE